MPKACVYFNSISSIRTGQADRTLHPGEQMENIYMYTHMYRVDNYNFVIMDGRANDTLKSLLARYKLIPPFFQGATRGDANHIFVS